jgi:hypothetical protein
MLVTLQLGLGFMAALVRGSRSAVSRLPGVTFDLYSAARGYRPEDYIIKIATSQHFLVLSINIKVTALAAAAGSALIRAARLTPGKLCLFPGFTIAVS